MYIFEHIYMYIFYFLQNNDRLRQHDAKMIQNYQNTFFHVFIYRVAGALQSLKITDRLRLHNVKLSIII